MNKRQRAKQQKLATIRTYQAVTGSTKRQARDQIQKKKTNSLKPSYSLISYSMAELQAIVDCHASIKSIISKAEDFVNGKVSRIQRAFGIDIKPVTWCKTVDDMDTVYNEIKLLWDKFVGIKEHNQYFKNLKKATQKSGCDEYFSVESEFREHIQDTLNNFNSFEGWKRYVAPTWKSKVADYFYDSGQQSLRDIGTNTDFYIIEDEEELKRLNEL